MYTTTQGQPPVPCLFYVPFWQPACVYPDITLPSLSVATLQGASGGVGTTGSSQPENSELGQEGVEGEREGVEATQGIGEGEREREERETQALPRDVLEACLYGDTRQLVEMLR